MYLFTIICPFMEIMFAKTAECYIKNPTTENTTKTSHFEQLDIHFSVMHLMLIWNWCVYTGVFTRDILGRCRCSQALDADSHIQKADRITIRTCSLQGPSTGPRASIIFFIRLKSNIYTGNAGDTRAYFATYNSTIWQFSNQYVFEPYF